MDMEVHAVQVTDRFLRSSIYFLANKPGVDPGIQLLPSNSETEFQGHIEPWSRRRRSIQFHSRKVVNGVTTRLNQVEDPLEPIGSSRDSQSCFWG
jgi:hypothetical protein